MKKRLLKDADESNNNLLFSDLYNQSSFIGKMFFSFAKPLLNQILKNENFDDTQLLSIYGGSGGSHGAEQEISQECNLFMHTYAEQRDLRKRSVPGAMLATLFTLYKRNFLLCLFTAISAEVLAIYCCYNVGYLTEFMISPEKTSHYQISFLILFSLAFLGQIFLRNLHYFLNALISLKLKRLFMSSLYRKLSRLSLDSMGEISDGKLISLLQSFIFILEKILVLVYYCAVAPVMMMIACALISIKGGLLYALLVQVLYLCLFLIQWAINKLIGKIIVTESGQNDKRIGLVYQLLLGLRTIKCFGLETFFLQKVLKMRETQVKYMRIQTALSSVGWALLNNSGYFISLAVLLIAWHANSFLNVSFSFSTLTILAYLSTAVLSLSLGGMTGVMQFQHVCTRVGTILDLQEQKSLRMLPESRLDKAYVKMNDCGFSWSFYQIKTSQLEEAAGTSEGPKLALQNLNFSLRSGELMIVIGQVGCGKTTFLKSILNETKLVRGEMEIKGRIAYVEQDPFIFPGTVKDNILFGKEFDREKFQEVIKLCELESDFKQMENGEETVMGDAGCNVSGGQKARISLARALYEDADIYLLDNPISALDAQISQKIIENVVKGYLKQKCTILITSQPKIVPQIDKLLVIDYGYQVRFGSPEEIYQEYGYLNDMISNEPSEAFTDVVCQAEETDEHEICLTEKGDNDSVKVGKETIITPKVEEKLDRTNGVGDAAAKIFSKYALGPMGVIIYIFLSALPPLLLISAIYWLGLWAAYPYSVFGNFYANRFMITVGLAVLVTIARNIYSYYLILLGSNRIHNLMIERVLRGSITYFDVNPVGKLITRFAKDQFLVDQKLNFFVLIFSESLFAAIGSLLYSVVITPFAAIPVITLIGISMLIYNKCNGALAVLQKYENNSRDPLQANILTMLGGIITCRAYDNVKFFADPFEKQLQKSVNCSFSYVSIIRWQGLRVQLVGGFFTLSIAWLAVLLKEQVNSSLLSVLMVFVMDIAAYILVSILFYAEYQYCMPSVERMLHLTEIKQEDALIQPSDSELINWPQHGHVKFIGVQMRYREDLEPAVRDVSFEIEAGMKVGIVGRTGAGKSSILQSLFRLIDLSAGSVEIDGINIKTLGLHTLRKQIGYIPQQPFLFSGTVRENLDPFNLRTDEEIISVLRKTYLWDYISTLNGMLDHSIYDPNLTFSQGGKQLMCLARELLRDCKIMVLDEATANIDQYTDQLIQKTLREECKSQTMLTIAHRISTVIDADRILVMEKGRVAEYDHPFKLLTLKDTDTEITSDGYLAKMVKAYADDEQKWLFNIAKAQYFKLMNVEFDTVTECSYINA